MVKCVRCDFENTDTSTFCNNCGNLLRSSTSDIASPTGYDPILEYQQPVFSEQGFSSQVYTHQEILPRQKVTTFRVIRSFLYFIATLIAAFGLAGAFSGFGVRAGYLGIFFGLGLLVGSVFIFVRTRHRFQHLNWSQYIWWILGATVGIFMAWLLEFVFVSGAPNGTLGSFIFGWIILLYGIVLAGVSLW
jgi:hypothetical protein